MKLTLLFKDFFESEKAGGLILLICTAASLALANSVWGPAYQHFWHLDVLGRPVEFWINDGLMTVFFLLIGLEIEREMYAGELSDLRNALLPVVAATGGMAMPALLHFSFNHGTPFQQGMGIPMATDIAFSLGILSLLGERVPLSLKVFLAALAIIDDLGAILMIAIFYSKGFSFFYFGCAALLFGLMIALNRMKVYHIWLYLIIGVGLWYCMLQSGIHATITGILLAFAIPFGNGDERSPSYRLQHALHRPVAFLIVPVFALANTGIALPDQWLQGLYSANSVGIMAGLFLGKPVGIVLAVCLFLWFGRRPFPSEFNKLHLTGTGLLAGIGFTMSIFITLLAFDDPATIVHSKIAVLAASLLSGIAGFLLLYFTLPPAPSSG